MLTELYKQPGNYTMPSARKYRAWRRLLTMEGLRELSKMYLKTTEEAIHTPAVPHKPTATLSDNVKVIPDNPTPTPRRAIRKVANLDPTTVVGNNGLPVRNTRAKSAVTTAALAAIMSNNQADAKQWGHRKHSPLDHKLELNKVTSAVLEGDKMLKYATDTAPSYWRTIEALLLK